MAQNKVDLPSSPHSSSQGEVSDGVEVADESKDCSQVDNTDPTHSHTDGMEKLIYLHIARMGDSILKGPQLFGAGFVDATNDWYVIKRGSDGGVILLPAFQDVKPLNYPNNGLRHTACEVIGSCIYVIGGCDVFGEEDFDVHITDPGSRKIRCLDTLNPSDGWRTCATLPFNVCETRSTVVNDQQLYLFGGHRHIYFYDKPQKPWGYTLNLHHDGKGKNRGTKIVPPGRSPLPPIVSTLSPSSLVVYMEDEETFYHLDCTNNAWSVYHKDVRYYPYLLGAGAIAASDGILYIHERAPMRLISYDLRNKKELHVVDLPSTFWFGRDNMVNLIVLAKDKFCIIFCYTGEEVNSIYIYYNRFSVSYLHPKPTVDVEEQRHFRIAGYDILNVVTMDSHEDAATNSLS